jgi:hypothetical protein
MSRTTLVAAAFAALFSCPALLAQRNQISLSGTYGLLINDDRPDVRFDAIGVALGYEGKITKHFTLGGDLDWQFVEPELTFVDPYFPLTAAPAPYSIERRQINVRPTLRYYFKRAFRGLYLGAFGTYTYTTVTTSGYPKDDERYTQIYVDPSDNLGVGGGLTYGFRLKLTKHLRASAYGSHQLFKYQESPKPQQQNHQWGLGLSWVL